MIRDLKISMKKLKPFFLLKLTKNHLQKEILYVILRNTIYNGNDTEDDLDQRKKLRDVLQEREVASFDKF